MTENIYMKKLMSATLLFTCDIMNIILLNKSMDSNLVHVSLNLIP